VVETRQQRKERWRAYDARVLSARRKAEELECCFVCSRHTNRPYDRDHHDNIASIEDDAQEIPAVHWAHHPRWRGLKFRGFCEAHSPPTILEKEGFVRIHELEQAKNMRLVFEVMDA
jgi:hypothetical protein